MKTAVSPLRALSPHTIPLSTHNPYHFFLFLFRLTFFFSISGNAQTFCTEIVNSFQAFFSHVWRGGGSTVMPICRKLSAGDGGYLEGAPRLAVPQGKHVWWCWPRFVYALVLWRWGWIGWWVFCPLDSCSPFPYFDAIWNSIYKFLGQVRIFFFTPEKQ